MKMKMMVSSFPASLLVCSALLLLGAAHVSSQTCGVPKCVGADDPCSAVGDVCASGLYCNGTYVCSPALQLGGACTDNRACIGSDIGTTVCWNGICQAITNNAKAGEACSYANQCLHSLFCNTTEESNTGTCIQFLPTGSSCSYNDRHSSCNHASVCSSGKCIERYSIPKGGQCSYPTTVVISYECQAGLYCNQSNICAPGFTSSNAPCNMDCTNPNEYCSCVGTDTKCIAPLTLTSSQVNDMLSFTKCALSSNCNAEAIFTGIEKAAESSHQDTSCCHREQCVLYEVFGSKDGNSTCGYSNPWSYCGKGASSHTGKIIFAVGIVVVAALSVILLAYYLRRKTQPTYHAIQ